MTTDFKLGGDLPIHRLGFGAMRLPTGTFRGPARDPELGRRVLRRAIELGVNHIDTAALYASSDGRVRANVLIREALHPYPAGLVIATKVGPVRASNGALRAGRANELRADIEGNLETLGLARLELVYLRIGHDLDVPHGESLGERFEVLAKLREEGLIRHLGVSNVDAKQLAEARAIAPVAAVQNNFHLANRDETAVLDACIAHGIAFAPFFPLGGGMTKLDGARSAAVAARLGKTTSQVALAWLLALAPLTLAIPGTGSLAHLEENVAAGAIALTPKDLAELG